MNQVLLRIGYEKVESWSNRKDVSKSGSIRGSDPWIGSGSSSGRWSSS